jgi:hypothetical protein
MFANVLVNMWFTSSFMGKQFLSSSDLRFGIYDRNQKSPQSLGKAGQAGSFTLGVKISDPTIHCQAEVGGSNFRDPNLGCSL